MNDYAIWYAQDIVNSGGAVKFKCSNCSASLLIRSKEGELMVGATK